MNNARHFHLFCFMTLLLCVFFGAPVLRKPMHQLFLVFEIFYTCIHTRGVFDDSLLCTSIDLPPRSLISRLALATF